MVALAIALLTLGALTSRRIAEDLGSRVLDDAGDQVRSQLDAYLSVSVQKSNLYARRIHWGRLPVEGDLSRWERMMLDDLVTSPQVASICFTNVAGDSTWLLRHGDRLELGRAVGADGCAAIEHEITPEGVIKIEPVRKYIYDGRVRPWYQAALEKRAAHWTPVYFWFGDVGSDSETGTGYTRAIRSDEGKLLGVLVVDTTLNSISQFLRKLPVAELGHVFIVDEKNMLVAASHGEIIGTDKKRLPLKESPHPAGRAAVAALADKTSDSLESITLDKKPARVRVVDLEPYEGIRWRAVIVLPESAFMGTAHQAHHRAIAVSVFLVTLALILCWFLVRAMTRPLLKLSDHVGRVGAGDFSAKLDLSGARELVNLSHDLNQMTEDLKHRVELQQSIALATQVQQSLLPAHPPATSMLEIYGMSRYCDSTGGDYYDYIKLSPMPKDGLLVAVGDVMGHGIASSLLMASARAALRAKAQTTDSLAELVNTVNAVLTRDNRHGRFMTLLLVLVDPHGGRVRFASAGHDPAKIYDPRTRTFTSLEGGDLPLGVSHDVKYEEYGFDKLSPGQIVFMGTDGVWEARSPNGKMFGKAAFGEIIQKHAHESAEEIGRALEAAIDKHTAGKPPRDDVTVVIVKVKNAGAA